jgi:hypothetical protein
MPGTYRRLDGGVPGYMRRKEMDVRFFLKARIHFIRQLYDTSTAPYLRRQRQIEAHEEPFVPPYSEDGEPPFLMEWHEAEESKLVLGYSCISMLAASLHLYLKTLGNILHQPIEKDLQRFFTQGGWLRGYSAYFERHLGIRFSDSPVNLGVLEEVILARNRVQHPEDIVFQRAHYSESDLDKLSNPFFVNERERDFLMGVDEADSSWLLPPTLHIDAKKLSVALEAAEHFCDWLEDEFDEAVYGRKK